VSRKKALIKGIIRAKFRINQTFSNDKSEINSRAGKIRENTKLIRSGLKTSDHVREQDVARIENGAYRSVREYFNPRDNAAIGH